MSGKPMLKQSMLTTAINTATVVKQYNAEPTLALFHNDPSFVKYVEGPFGSGKSSGCIMDIVMRGMRQQADGNKKRRSRWAVVRQTYPELKSTTIKTFEYWVPPSIAPVTYGIPYTAKFNQNLHDGTRMELEFVFLALEGPDDVKKLLSFELTGAYLNEARELAWEIIENLIGRIPRYPETIKEPVLDDYGNKQYTDTGKLIEKTVFGPTEPGIILDSNPPRTSHWLYEKFETGAVPDGWKKFKQPPAVYFDTEEEVWKVNPDAENLAHLPDQYYENQIKAATDDFIRVNLAGQYGMSRKGKPVFSKYSEHKHVAKEMLNPERGYPIIIGMDFGLTPASVFLQVTGRGVRILDELPASDEMLEDYLAEYVNPLIIRRYQGFSIVACGDPAGKNRSRIDKRSDFDLLRTNNIRAFACDTNDIVTRLAAVNWFLSRDGGFVVSPHLTHLREAMAGGYVFKEAKNAQGAVLDTPLKNAYSHIADSLQYGCWFARFGGRYMPNKPQSGGTKTPFLYA